MNCISRMRLCFQRSSNLNVLGQPDKLIQIGLCAACSEVRSDSNLLIALRLFVQLGINTACITSTAMCIQYSGSSALAWHCLLYRVISQVIFTFAHVQRRLKYSLFADKMDGNITNCNRAF